MTDCYRILGISRQASPAEIRAAYLARMKERHPDARRDGSADEGDAGEISFAYWQLRDAERRAEHDRQVFADLAPRPPRKKRKARGAAPQARRPARRPDAKPKISARRRARQGRRLQPMRTAAGIAACALAATAFLIAFTTQPQGGGPAKAATALSDAGAAARRPNGNPTRRRLNPAIVEAASDAFRDVVQHTGVEGAHRYTRHCLLELGARPTMSMLDFCLAFDDRGAAWERDPAQAQKARERPAPVYFAEEQRFDRYRSTARDMRPSEVRDAMEAEVEYFADATPRTTGSDQPAR